MKTHIPKDEHENVLSMFWQLLGEVESSTDPKKDPVKAHIAASAYTLLNRIGYTQHRPQWERANASHEPCPQKTKE